MSLSTANSSALRNALRATIAIMSDKIYASREQKREQVQHAHNVSDVEVKERKCGLGPGTRKSQFRALGLRLFLGEGRAIETSWNDGAATLRGPYLNISNQPHGR